MRRYLSVPIVRHGRRREASSVTDDSAARCEHKGGKRSRACEFRSSHVRFISEKECNYEGGRRPLLLVFLPGGVAD